MPLARRTAIGMVALALAALTGLALPGAARADPPAPPGITDKRSPGGGHGGSHSASPPTHPTDPPTPTPTVQPTDPPASNPPSPVPAPSKPPGTAVSGPMVPAGGPPVDASPISTDGLGAAIMVGRRLGPGSQLAGVQPSASAGSRQSGGQPERASGLGATDTVRLAGTAVPLWLVVGGGALVVLSVVVGLLLTLRDRDKRPGPESIAPPELPTSVKFG